MIKPFADDNATSSIGNLSIENGTARVVLSGSVEFGRDEAGLTRARELKLLADGLVQELESSQLSEQGNTAEIAAVDRVTNPFA